MTKGGKREIGVIWKKYVFFIDKHIIKDNLTDLFSKDVLGEFTVCGLVTLHKEKAFCEGNSCISFLHNT